MVKYPITYTDFNGNIHTEDLWFHISKSSVLTMQQDRYNEIVELGKQIQQKATFVAEAEKSLEEAEQVTSGQDPFNKNQIVVADAVRAIAQLLDKVIDLAYGQRSDDGLRFIRTKEVIEDFKQTVIYDSFMEKMITNPSEMTAFIEKLMAQSK